jgi:hypothetical protein
VSFPFVYLNHGTLGAESDAPVDDDWPVPPMTRLTLSFLVQSRPEGTNVDGTAQAVDDLRERLDYRG